MVRPSAQLKLSEFLSFVRAAKAAGDITDESVIYIEVLPEPKAERYKAWGVRFNEQGHIIVG